jgi:pimeloyl-ACP methyl ester carboxylesterase
MTNGENGMRSLVATAGGARVRWVQMAGAVTPALLYLHGLGAASAPYFAEVASHPALRTHRSVLVDLLGFGLSDRPDDFGYRLEEQAEAVARVVLAAGLGPVWLVGHSMGGTVAIHLASQYPELVEGLVVADPNLDASAPEWGASNSRGIAAYAEQAFVDAPDAELAALVGSEWWATMRLADRRAVHRSAVALVKGSSPTARELLAELRIPRTLMWSMGEDLAYDGQAALTAAGVDVIGLPDTGHNIMLDDPDAFAAVIRRAVARESAVGGATPQRC